MIAASEQSTLPASSALAWVLNFGEGIFAAIGDREMQYVIHSPQTTRIPLSPFCCDQVLVWNGQLLPVFDLACWITDGKQVCDNPLVGVIAYQQKQESKIGYAGFRLYTAPKRMRVYDEQLCPLPTDNDLWAKIAVSCFMYLDNTPIPILDLQTIFTQSSI